MSGKLPACTNDEIYIGNAKNMTFEFLKTLWEFDGFVNIMCFDGNRTIPLINAVFIKYNASQLYESFNTSLAAIISDGSVKTHPML